jgi:hypothetical protein
MKKHIGLYVVIITLLVFITAAAFSLGVSAQADTSTLELTVYQVEVTEGVATITGTAIGAEVELYDNLGEKLLDSGLTASDGKVKFTLNGNYPISGMGLYHTMVKVDGIDQGVMTCQLGTTCLAVAFSIAGLDQTLDDGILVVKVIRSDDLVTPVEGVRTNVWPADMNGTPLVSSLPSEDAGKWGDGNTSSDEFNGIACLTNAEGFCAVYLDQAFHWAENEDGLVVTNLLVKIGAIVSFDGSYYHVPEGGFLSSTIAVDQKGKLDDCIIKGIPLKGVLNSSCIDKVHRTATAEAQVTIDPAVQTAVNNAVIRADQLSRNTTDLFDGYIPDPNKEAELMEATNSGEINPVLQMKLILYVNEITHDGYNAKIGKAAIGSKVEVTKPDDPEQLLGVCIVNSLGECTTILNRLDILGPDRLAAFRVIAGGFDNGILVCKNKSVCEHHAYTVVGLKENKDAIVLVKILQNQDMTQAFPNKAIVTGKENLQQVSWGYGGIGGWWEKIKDFRRTCQSDVNGACPLYIDDVEFIWAEKDGALQAEVDVAVSGPDENDSQGLFVSDGQLLVISVAVDDSGSLDDCTFTSALDHKNANAFCSVKNKVQLTAIAGYTSTPTVTITPTVTTTPTITLTPLPSSTPNITEAPTATPISTPTPRPGLFAGESAPLAFGGIALLLVLLGGGAWLILRTRNKRS